MELIYTNKNRLALGQLSSFDIDFDATGDKDFELTIDEYILQKGYWFFIPNTEIGGIVDSITVNTENNSVKYFGRNFRGILNDKIITVPSGWNYVSVQGDLTEAINELLSDAGLTSLFECLAPMVEDTDTEIDFAFEPFCTLYDGLIALAASINCKLIFAYNVQTNKVEITPMLTENFTNFLTYTKNSSVNLEIEDNSMAVNHFLLVGYNEGKRYQISLYVNENSQIMDYSTVLTPIKDSQYILDNRNQSYFGIDEKTQLKVTDSISPIENYEYISTKPSDWYKNYADYYYQKTEADGENVNVSYEHFEAKIVYQVLSSQPSDWANNYANYFEIKDGNYTNIDAVSTTSEDYKKVKKKPKGWKETYGEYYYKENDGVQWYYTSVPGNNKDYYKKQKYQPTDWKQNFNSYYQVLKNPNNKKTEYVTAGTWWKKEKSGKYTKQTPKKAPKWEKYKFYTKYTKTYAPKFSKKDVYIKVETTTESAPTFVANAVYRQYETCPNFNGCYHTVLDHYGGMIQNLLKDLDVRPINKQTVNLVDFEADIGDVVGGFDEKTGLELSAPITNIIYKIERGLQRSIEYELGG